MDYYYALTYSKSMYNVEEACRDFVERFVFYDMSESILNNFNSVNFVEENNFLILEEGTRNIIILSQYDFEDFNFIKGERL
ncbi:hypothetical protein [Romboutsia ilealis]|uniref:hypothetical protein n=1 Tax=Romboutsia ilealis TaxID=1115758 RepID=UPI00257405DA|nr:hypothetical protein [Romboutsia ilealis]